MAKLAHRKDIDRLLASFENLSDDLTANGATLNAMSNKLAQGPVVGADLERLATLLDGVRVSLERMGGNTLPSMMTDVHALRDQMAEFRREMAGYRATLMTLSNWLETVTKPPEPPVRPDPPKRSYNRRQKSKPEVEKTNLDVAPHNGENQGRPISSSTKPAK